MLPGNLSSTYSRYKQDTDAIASWLATTAKRFGYVAEAQSRNARRNAARKAKKENKNTPTHTGRPTYTVALKDFSVLAKFIAQKEDPKIRVPERLAALLDRTITARQWFSKSISAFLDVTEEKLRSDDRHVFFLRTLEEVRNTLRPCYSTEHKTKTPQPKDFDDVINLFEHLELEDTSKAFDDAPDVVLPPMDGPADAVYKAEKEEEDIYECYLAFHFFIRDLNRLRTEVSRAWHGVAQGSIDVIAASICTNTAVDLARALEEDLKDLFAKGGGPCKMLEVYYYAQWVTPEMLKAPPRPLEPVNFETYDAAEALFRPAASILDAFCDLLQANPTPEMKKGFYGTYDPSSDRSKKNGEEKFLEDKILMLEALSEFFYHCRASPGPFPAEDELIISLRQVFKTKKLNMAAIFGMTLFLDIHHTLRANVDQGFTRLCMIADYVRNNITANNEFHTNLSLENWPRQNQMITQFLVEEIKAWVHDDPHRAFAVRMKRLNIPKPFQFYQCHPWFCGLLAYNILARYHEMSIIFANAWGAIMSTAHLYNAVQKEKMLKEHWKDMDAVFAMQGSRPFFVGEAPKDPDEYLKRFGMAMGMSATNLAAKSSRKSKNIVHSKRGPQSMRELAPVLRMFKERFCLPNARRDLRTEDVQKIIEQSEWSFDEDGETSPGIMFKDSGEARKRAPGPAKPIEASQLLHVLLPMLNSELVEMGFDYLALHRFCWRLLRSLRDDCRDDLIRMYGPSYVEKEEQFPFIVGYILMTASVTKQLGAGLVKQRNAEVTSAVLQKAAKTLHEMLEAGAGEIVVGKLMPHIGFSIEFQIEGAEDGAE
ncbi:hypothetical protein M011DRAFT_471557 [Sporormia fimetaria CBS 119925]|uniref:DUF6604 domain-containing protein n=1 Tax=Sporormia fimetaria CBS 119925 TaxID=1340428 RepID=A0A6A6V1W2_9PLEO|nr:hypothetical protein M011DRAFT_471557 [Sporormia fimetaria CBS 119925]